MQSDAILDLKQEDQKLTLGALVRVYWRAYGYKFQSRGRVSRLTHQQAEVRLLAPVSAGREYPPFKTVCVPRISCSTAWSSSCCLRLELS